MTALNQFAQDMSNRLIIIGAGLAGIVAACAAQQEGVEVVLVDRSGIGLGSNTAMSNGRFTGPTDAYSVDNYICDTLHLGKMINHRPTVEKTAHKALEAFRFFRSMGIEFQENVDHYFNKVKRLDVQRGASMARQLAGYVKTLKNIKTLSGFYVTEILQDGKQAVGIRGITKGGETVSIFSPSIILAAGGAGAIYLWNDNQKSAMGQGYYLAVQTGLSLWDMEFVQFYPVVIAEPRLPAMMIYPPYPKTVGLINATGKDLLKKYGVTDVNDAMRKRRDSLSQILYAEGLNETVYMDLRNVSSSDWNSTSLNMLKKMKFDFHKNPVQISPGAHFFMGGLRTNKFNQTDLKGLYACGEMCWGFHGANRLGGNALTECLVSGMVAGRHAADYLRSRQPASFEIHTETKRISDASHGLSVYRSFKKQIHEIAWAHAGIIREETGLKHGLQKISELEDRLWSTTNETIEKKRKNDLMGAVFVLKAILTASLARNESRGAFVRREYPLGDNIEWRKNSCLKYNSQAKEFSVSHHDAVV
ncbi:FAD-binding protein [Thermodesulfobacteriota bacterium]